MPPEKGIVQGKEESPNAGEGSFLQFKITLKGIRPPIWRRFLVPEGLSLSDLHDVIQEVMGWWNSHLHQFVYQRKRYGVPDPEWDFDKIIDDSRVALKGLGLSVKDKILYEYDFGDGWEHELLLEKTLPAEGRMSPVCLKGARACPPEDCGGPWGYENLLEVLKNPEDEEYASWKEWLPEDFDPEHFDLDGNQQSSTFEKMEPAFSFSEETEKDSMSVPLIHRGQSGKAFSKGLHPQHLTKFLRYPVRSLAHFFEPWKLVSFSLEELQAMSHKKNSRSPPVFHRNPPCRSADLRQKNKFCFTIMKSGQIMSYKTG